MILDICQGIIDNHLLPYFGDAVLADISRGNIKDFVKAKEAEERPSAKTINNILLVLHQILADAQVDGILIRNPFLKIERPRIERKEMEFLRTKEIKIFLDHCSPSTRALFYTAIFTGMRRRELLSVQWGDIDWNSEKIYIRRSLYRGNFQTPKSTHSIRAIDMGPMLGDVLKTHRARQNEIRLKAGKDWIDNGLIFCRGNGEPLDPDNLYHREFKPILKRTGLREINIHSLRHTFASILIAAGHSPKYIQNQMGHASINITMDLYGHLMPEVHQGAAERSENIVFGNVTVTDKEKEATA
jgi:integrase